MDTLTIITIIGGIALLVALFGGGIKAKEIEIPSISGSLRILSGIIGIILIGIAVRLSYPTLPIQTSIPQAIALASTQTAVSTDPSVDETTPKPALVQNQPDIHSPDGDELLYEDFEDRKADEFRFSEDEWQVKDDGSGNHVLETDSSNYSLTHWTQADFGPTAKGDYSIQYRVRLGEYDISQDTGSGLVSLLFRQGPAGSYGFQLNPFKQRIELNHTDANGSWTPLDDGKGVRSFDFEKNTWYLVRIEVYGSQIKAFFDDELLFEIIDTRLTSGGLAFFRGPNTIAQFDDVQINE